MDIDLGRANPVLTYAVGLFLGWSATSSHAAGEGSAVLINASFAVAVFALVVLGEISHRAGEE